MDPMSPRSTAENLLRLAVHAAPAGIIIVNREGTIVFANRTMLNMFGYPEEELLGQPVEILVPETLANAHRQQRELYSLGPSRRDMGVGKEFEGLTKTGRRIPIEIGLRPDESENGQMIVATVIDISERKAIEDRLRRHEEHLEELVAERTRELHEAQAARERAMARLIQADKMAAIGTLVSGIGHEINNPLYVIMSLAEAMGGEYGEKIVRHSKHIAETVKNLSGYAQPAHKHELQRVDINASIDAAIMMVKRSLQSDEVEIKQSTGTVPEILAKTEEIQQVLFNVIRNAVQASSARDIVELESRHDDGWVSVSIHDAGGGIAEGDRKKIFDPFFTTKGPDEGEGLGLYIVQQIVSKYEGRIDLDSKRGKGTTFVIRFPAADRVGSSTRRESNAAPRDRPG